MTTCEERVDALDSVAFDFAAADMATQLLQHGAGVVILEPGDATSYKLLMARKPGGADTEFLFASNFGAVYPYSASVGDYHWSYVDSHFLDLRHSNEHGARVIARFLNLLSYQLAAAGPERYRPEG